MAMKKKPAKPAVVRRRLSLIPRSTARNAYQLLDEVIAAIIAEPARVNMGQWIYKPADIAKMKVQPSCGTVACVAGWVTILADHVVQNPRDCQVEQRASDLLLPKNYRHLRTALLSHVFHADGEDIRGLKVGSKAYIAAVVKRIRDFQQAHAEPLLQRQLSAAA